MFSVCCLLHSLNHPYTLAVRFSYYRFTCTIQQDRLICISWLIFTAWYSAEFRVTGEIDTIYIYLHVEMTIKQLFNLAVTDQVLGLFQIYDGANTSSKLFPKQPHISRGAWSRPVIASSGKSIYIKVNPSKPRRQRFVGFKATVYASDCTYSML